MRALTVRNPHAWALATGVPVDGAEFPQPLKPVENRAWVPGSALGVGSFLAIHAGKHRVTVDLRAWYRKTVRELGVDVDVPNVSYRRDGDPEMHFGAIVALARYAGTVDSVDELRARVGARGVPFWSGPVGWILEDVVELPAPVRASGALGLWRMSLAQIEGVREQVAAYAESRPLPPGLAGELWP